MLEDLFSPVSAVGPLILRLALGIIFLVHGRFKLQPTARQGVVQVAGWLKQIGVPLPLLAAWSVVLLETVGALLLILGLGTRILGILFAAEMLVVIVTVKRGAMKMPFMAQQGTGWELDFAVLAGALSLVFTGAGALALDRALGL